MSNYQIYIWNADLTVSKNQAEINDLYEKSSDDIYISLHIGFDGITTRGHIIW